MRKSFFKNNIMKFLIPIMIPLFILGALSITISQNDVKGQIQKNNSNVLKQIMQNMDIVFNSIYSLNAGLSTNSTVMTDIKKRLTRPSEVLSAEEYKSLNNIYKLISLSSGSNYYIDSIYIYFNNDYGKFISSEKMLRNVNEYFDSEWYHSYLSHNDDKVMWTELREVRQYDFQKEPVKYLTIYRKIGTIRDNHSDGVLVMNVLASNMNNFLNDLEVHKNQAIFVLDDQSNVIFHNKNFINFENINIPEILSHSENSMDINYHNKKYNVTKLYSEPNGWSYVTVLSHEEMFRLPNNLFYISIFLSVFSFISAVLITYYLAKKNYSYLTDIMSIVESAEKGMPFPPMPSRTKDEYGYIIHNILKTFIENDFLNLQLSEKLYREKMLELLALQSQINPHFLFNTLESIKWKTIGLTGMPNNATFMLENLSHILKYSIGEVNRDVTFLEEIKVTESYINIQMIRYADKFSVDWEYAPKIKGYKIIRLLFQPFIENSIYHGIKEKEGFCKIVIRILEEDDFLKIVISDTGKGIEEKKLEEIMNRLESDLEVTDNIGLINTKKRLAITYSNESSIHIKSKYNHYTIVEIKIPLRMVNYN